MEYDEIDQYVDQLFNRPEGGGGGEGEPPANGEVLSGDWRIDRSDQIIQDMYDEAIWWHNQRISEGTDPRSGLRSLPYVPPESPNVYAGMSLERNGTQWVQHASYTATQTQRSGLSCAEMALIGAVVVGLLIFMMVAS